MYNSTQFNQVMGHFIFTMTTGTVVIFTVGYIFDKYLGFKKNTRTESQTEQEFQETRSNVAQNNETEQTSDEQEDDLEEKNTTEEDKQSEHYDKEKQTNIEKAIQLVAKLDESDLQYLLEECSSRVLIPNWYTKSDLEKLSDANISDNLWNQILTSNDLIDKTNAMYLQWFDSKHNQEKNDSYDSDYVDEEQNDDIYSYEEDEVNKTII